MVSSEDQAFSSPQSKWTSHSMPRDVGSQPMISKGLSVSSRMKMISTRATQSARNVVLRLTLMTKMKSRWPTMKQSAASATAWLRCALLQALGKELKSRAETHY
jgi:hypothetical protein